MGYYKARVFMPRLFTPRSHMCFEKPPLLWLFDMKELYLPAEIGP